MKTITALLFAASTALTVSAPISAHALSGVSGYTASSAPAGTTDAARKEAGQSIPTSSDRVLGHFEPRGTTDAVRQQAGRRSPLLTVRLAGHIEPQGTTDAVRQQAGRQISGRFIDRVNGLVAVNP